MLNLIAGAYAEAALNAFLHVDVITGVRIIDFRRALHQRKNAFAYAYMLDHFLQATGAALRAGQTIQWMIGKQELRRPFAYLENLGILGRDLHPLSGWGGASGGQTTQTIDLDDTEAARAIRLKGGIVTQRRHVDLGGATGIEHRLALVNRDRVAIDRQVQHG